MIKYLFTRSNLIGSRLISYGTKYDFQKTEEAPSHFAILFFDRIILHSNFANGVHLDSFYRFKQKNQVVCAVRREKCEMGRIECMLLFDQLDRRAMSAEYDWPAILYFIWRIFLKWFLNKPMPDKNKWESENKWFCNELFEIIFRDDLSMKTPNDLMWMLLEHPDFTSTEVFQ